MDYDKLAKQFGGESLDIDKLAEQFGGQVIQPPPEPTLSPEEQVMSQIGADTTGGPELADYGKLFGAGATRGTFAAPEAVERGLAGISRDTTFKPTEFLNYISDPRKLTNDLAQAFRLPKIFEEDAKAGIVPEETVAKQRAAVDEVLTKGKIKSLRNLTEYGNRLSDRIADSVTPEMKLALADSQPTGNLIEAFETGDFSKISFGKDPSITGLLGHTAQSVGSFAPALATRVITKSPVVGGTVAFGQAGSEGVDEARKFVEKMTPEQLAKESPYFRNLILLGYDPKTAKEMTIDKAADSAAYMQGIVGALGNEFTANLMTGKFSKGLLANSRNKALQIVGGTATGMAEEGLQELAEGLATDLGINKAVVREMGADSFANLVLGALGGAGPGAVGGALRKPGEAAPETAAPETPAAPGGIRGKLAEFRQDYENLIGGFRRREAPTEIPQEIQQPTSLTPVIDEQAAPVKAPKVEPTPIVGEALAETDIEEEGAPQVSAAPKTAEVAKEEVKAKTTPASKFAKEMAGILQGTDTRFPMGSDKVYNAEAELFKFAKQNPDQSLDIAKELISNPDLYSDQTGLPPGRIKSLGKQLIDAFAEKEPAKTQAEINQERQTAQRAKAQEKELLGIDAAAVPLGEFHNGILMGMNGENVKSGLISDEALKLLKTNQLVSEDANGKLSLLPKGNALLNTIRQETGIGKEQTPEQRKEMFAKFIPQIAEAPKAEVKAEEVEVPSLRAEETPRSEYEQQASDDYNKVVDESYEGKRNETDVLANQSLDRYIPFDKLVDIVSNAKNVLLAPEQLKMRFGVQKAADAERVIQAVRDKKKTKKPEVKVTANKVFTDDAAEKARALLKSKLNQLNSGIDPEVLQAGIILSGYHVEKGARTFAAYSAAMIKDLGDAVKPYLKSWYMALKYDPRSEEFKDEMDSADVVDKFEFEKKGEFPDLLTPEGKFEVAQRVTDALLAGAKYENIAAARQFIKGIIGRTINPGTAEAKEADEAIETGVVMAARQIVEERNSPQETYDKLVDLYNRQPNLTVRTSTSVKEQAYSTPAPLAYIASQLAGITKDTTVYEPTAGNGMLLIGANPKNVIANELNATRYEMLKRVMPDAEVVNKNALSFDPTLSDVVIANPPFGAIGEEVTVSGKTTREIDHAIAYKALGRMPVNGRAVLIVGGVRGATEDARREGYRSAQKRNFYANLYKEYNVVDHFTVDGDLYKKQGAAYPVDVIVINGKGQSERLLPAADLPQIYSSYEQLKEKLDEASRMESAGVRRAPGVAGGEAAAGAGEPEAVGRGTVRPSERAGAEREEPRAGGEPSVPEAGRAVAKPSEPARAKPSERKPGTLDVLERGNPGQEPVPFSGEGSQRGVGTDVQRSQPSELGGPSTVAGTRVESRIEDRRGLEEETETQVAYEPHSEANAVGTLVPIAMRDAIDQSLILIENQVGNLDEYVAKSLEISVDDLLSNFSAEQIDALALSIKNASEGKGFIIGDQTGIGKGRVVAAMIKYALVNGKIPIFVTEKPNLYSDMMRDLDDIGMTKELGLDTAKPKVFITNGSESIPYKLVRKQNGEPVETKLILKAPKTGKSLDAMMQEMIDSNSLGQYKVIFTTYSQLQTVKGKTTERAKFIKHFGEDNYMIFDESHNAGGAGETRGKEDGPEGRAAFVRNLVSKAYGTFFSSATYAKRPDVMDLYSSTNMRLAVDKPSMLGDAIKNGGVPMQQIVATMLTKDGQYIRRERTFKGVAYNTQETFVDKQTAENMASAMREVLSFSRDKDVVLKQMQKEYDKEAKVVSEYGGGEKTTIQGANFGAIMHNLIDQMLLSLKAQDSVKHAIERLKAGEKVVMTVSNTMGSFLQQYAEDMNIKTGEEVNLSFADLYIRYLDKQRMIKIKGPEGVQEYRLTDEDLGPTLTAKYERIRQQILDSGFGSAPISPIDYMHNELRKAGYKTDEITGRTITLNYGSGKPVLQSRTANIKQRVDAVSAFNDGTTDVIILNQAGSTGVSLHASEGFKDQRKRHMIIVQPEKNIDVHVQMLGRVLRTGQVVKPAYSQMMADIPAEMRPAAVLLKKMASLNANTTASRKSAVTAEGVVDFMNDYGGQVAMEFLSDNPDVYEALGGEKLMKVSEDEESANEAAIRRLTGYIPILPIKQQEEVYEDLIARYNELIERENAMGTNKLEAKAVDLDAETISREPITKDKGAASIFSQPAYMERVDVKRTVKPYSKAEVLEMVEKNLDGKSRAEKNGEMRNDLQERTRAYAKDKVEKMQAAEVDPIKVENFKADMNAMYAKMKTILDTYRLGDQISIKDQNGVFTYGVVTNITNSKKTANPAAGSDWKMQIALANGESKSLDISFSQIGTRFELKVTDEVNWLNPETNSGEYTSIIDIFDKGSTVRREKRWMVTGNILGGFATYPGQIITYTKKDGTIGQGVLMNRQFDFEKAKKEAPVYLRTAGDVIMFLNKVGGEVGTDDNQLRIIKRGDRYDFVTPRSKRQGGKYFANDGITRIIGSFYSRGNDMIASTYRQEVAESVINYILDVNQMNQNIVVKTGTEQAREMFAPKLSQEEINQIRQADKAREGGNFYNNFSEDVGEKDLIENIPTVRDEKIQEFKALRQAGRRLVKQVAKYGSTVPLQKQLNEMLAEEENLRQFIKATKVSKNTAAEFMARATKGLSKGEITADVEAFIRRMYEKHPTLLEGLKLSITAKGKKDAAKSTGNFNPFKRTITLWRRTSGVVNPNTVRHEIMHSLEQMMTPEAREAVIAEWARALETAMRQNIDKRSRDYFDAVLEFLANPSQETLDAATNKLPSYSFYQYLNPSEYWAVNAEKLMAAKLGTPWQRFVNGVKALIEGLKRFFGFNNKYAVHQALNALLKGQQIRTTENMLMDYIADGKYKVKLLNNVQDEQDLVDKYDLPDVPGHDPRSFKDMMIGAYEKIKDVATGQAKMSTAANKTTEAIGEAWDKSTEIRIKNAWFGAGLDEADFKRYKGQIRAANGMAIASVAVKNAIHSGYIATQVILRGGLEYSQKFGQFIAVERAMSMANVVRYQYKLRQKLGAKLADKIINGYFVAKRSRSIQNEYLDRTAEVENIKSALLANPDVLTRNELNEQLEIANRKLRNIRLAYEKIPYYMCKLNPKKPYITKDGESIPNVEYGPDGLPILNDQAIDDFIALENQHSELGEMMANWTAVNHNMLDNMAFSGRLSKKEVDELKAIKDYVPWYRIMDEEEPLYDAERISGNTSGVKHFKAGRTERDVDNVVDSMLHNVSIMTRSSIRNYANNRVAMEYGERRMVKDPKTGQMVPGRLKVYPTTGRDEKGVRVPIFVSGRRVVINIPESQVAEAVLGLAMQTPDFIFQEYLSTTSNLFRRLITFSGYFQLKQVFYDAPTAAWVSGVKSPYKVWAGTFSGFLRAVNPFMDDATMKVLQSAGIGGYQSFHRSEKKERALELGLVANKNWSIFLKSIDHVGDASDYSQRISVYKQVLKETGDPAQAMLQASDIIDWQKHGNGRVAMVARSTVTFIQAWATSLDALAQAAMGKGFKGKTQKEALRQFAITGASLASVCLLYAILAGSDDDYWELDDMTRARNFYVPFSKKVTGHHVLIPMHSSAAYFFKVMPEMLYTTIVSQGTKNEVDRTRLTRVLGKMFVDSVLGPTPVPTGFKAPAEVLLDHNFFTGGNVTPRGMQGLDAAQQYNASTSELGKILSKLTEIPFTGGEGKPNKRALNPMEVDHLLRGMFGSAGALSMWFSNQLFAGPERPKGQLKDNPFLGGLVGADVQRKQEDLLYDLKDRTEESYNTFRKLHMRGKHAEANQYMKDNKGEIQAHAYVLQAEAELKRLNAEIRRVGETVDPKWTPESKRQRLNELAEKKNTVLRGVIEMRKRAKL